MDEKIKLNLKDIKIRKKWPGDFSPETKIETPKKGSYKRSISKQEIQKALDEMNEDEFHAGENVPDKIWYEY